jgi:truncated hemoglobin YjbI
VNSNPGHGEVYSIQHYGEQNLRSQLQKASITMKQKNEKISEMEKTLLETSNKLREAEDSLKQRQVYTG